MRDLDVASGGPSRSVPALAESQSQFADVRVTVLYRDRGNPVVKLAKSKVIYQALTGGDVLFGSGLKPAFQSGADCIVHLHGVWSPMLHRAAGYARKQSLPYVISTRGMLAQWAMGHKALKKKIAWRLYQEGDLKGAAVLLVSSEFEREDVSALLPESTVVVIPNGCEERPAEVHAYVALPSDKSCRWALAMGRLHPVKGFAELIEAWAGLGSPDWRLAIAGPDEDGYRTRLEQLIGKHDLGDRVVMLGEVNDAQKWSLLDQCELFVAPSKTENFGMAIAEALQSGTPVITTTGTPWRELNTYDCGWWVGPGTDELRRVLKVATDMDVKVLGSMGTRGKFLITEKYSWNQVAANTIALYQSILFGDAVQ